MTDETEPASYRLHNDQKWSNEYNPADNDRPIAVWRNGVLHDADPWLNLHAAMFYALKEAREELEHLKADASQTIPTPRAPVEQLANRVASDIDTAVWHFVKAKARDMTVSDVEKLSTHVQSAAEHAIKKDPEA